MATNKHMNNRSNGNSDMPIAFVCPFPPHPNRLPLGEGTGSGQFLKVFTVTPQAANQFSLSPRERARVRRKRLINIKRVSESEASLGRSMFPSHTE